MQNESYKDRIQRHSPPSPVVKNCLCAFFIGGGICFSAQWIKYLCLSLGADENSAGGYVSILLIFAAALLTGIGVFDNIARVAGAGTLVPVTGFANAVVSPAIDTKSEGLILGVGGKIFTVAGPVILFGLLAGSLYGAVLWLVGLL